MIIQSDPNQGDQGDSEMEKGEEDDDQRILDDLQQQVRARFLSSSSSSQPLSEVSSFRQNLFYRALLATQGRASLATKILLTFLMDSGPFYNYSMTEDVQKIVFQMLALAIAGGDLEKYQTLLKSPGRVCGHVFSKGEVIYRCKTCAMDETCVMCSRCFQSSNHDGHDILFFLSPGDSGCCDCGDDEAWRTPLDCAYHKRNSAATALDPVVESCSRSVVSAMLGFVISTFSAYRGPIDDFIQEQTGHLSGPILQETEEVISLFRRQEMNVLSQLSTVEYERLRNSLPELVSSLAPARYDVVVHNDDVHTYDHVIATFTKHVGVDEDTAKSFAEIIDTIGRTIVCSFPTEESARKLQGKISGEKQTGTQQGLAVNVTPSNETFKQSLAQILLESLRQLCQQNVPFRLIVCDELCRVFRPGCHPERVEFLLKIDIALWKLARRAVRELFFYSLLLESHYKEILGSVFVANYNLLVSSMLRLDRERNWSISHISVQLFTTPSTSFALVSKNRLLETISETLVGLFSRYQNDGSDRKNTNLPKGTIDCSNQKLTENRETLVHILSDSRYFLGKPAIQNYVASRPLYLNLFLGLVELFQGMDPQERKNDVHIEYEQDSWHNAFHFSLFHIARLQPLLAECYAHPNTDTVSVVDNLVGAIRIAYQRIYDWMQRQPSLSLTLLNEGSCPCIEYNASSSFHSCLHWMLGTLLETLIHQIDMNETLSLRTIFPEQLSILYIMESPLRTVTKVAQIFSHLWIRNGYSMIDQATLYTKIRERGCDMDLLILQSAAVVLGADRMVSILLHRFGLESFFTATSVAVHEEKTRYLASEFLQFLISLVSERWIISKIPERERIRKCIIHALCIEPMSRSDFTKILVYEMTENPLFDEVLNEVANKEHGTCELKEEYYREYDPFFPRFRRPEREKANENVMARWKRTKSYYPPSLPPTCRPFAELGDVVHSRVLLRIMFYALFPVSSFALPSHPLRLNPFVPIVDAALHLFILALVECQQSPNKERTLLRLLSTEKFDIGNSVDGIQAIDFLTLFLDIYRQVRRQTVALVDASDFQPRLQWCFDALLRVAFDPERQRISDLLSAMAEEESQSSSSDSAKRKSEMAQRMKEKIMADFAMKQKLFLDSHKDFAGLDDDEDEDLRNEKPDAMEQEEEAGGFAFEGEVCTVCQEALSLHGRPFGVLAYVQSSMLLSHDYFRQNTPQEFHGSCRSIANLGVRQRKATSLSNEETRASLTAVRLDVAIESPPATTSVCLPQSVQETLRTIADTEMPDIGEIAATSAPPSAVSASASASGASSNKQPQSTPAFSSPTSHFPFLSSTTTTRNDESNDSRPHETKEFPYVQSCGHLMHLDCFGRLKATYPSHRVQHLLCPLCKSVSNTFLPILQRTVNTPIVPTSDVLMNMEFGDWLVNLPELLPEPGWQSDPRTGASAASPSSPSGSSTAAAASPSSPPSFVTTIFGFSNKQSSFTFPKFSFSPTKDPPTKDPLPGSSSSSFWRTKEEPRQQSSSGGPRTTDTQYRPRHLFDREYLRKQYKSFFSRKVTDRPRGTDRRANASLAKAKDIFPKMKEFINFFGTIHPSNNTYDVAIGALAYTVRCMEVANRGVEQSSSSNYFFEGLRKPAALIIAPMSECIHHYATAAQASDASAFEARMQNIRSFLERVVLCDDTKATPESVELLKDPFTQFLHVFFWGNRDSQHLPYLIRLFYLLDMVRVLLRFCTTTSLLSGDPHLPYMDAGDNAMDTDDAEKEKDDNDDLASSSRHLASLLQVVAETTFRASVDVSRIPARQLLFFVRSMTLPFLRQVSLFLDAYYGPRFARNLRGQFATDDVAAAAAGDSSPNIPKDDEYSALLQLLRLPALQSAFFDSPSPSHSVVGSLAAGWCSMLRGYLTASHGESFAAFVRTAVGPAPSSSSPAPFPVNIMVNIPLPYFLVTLPERFDSLLELHNRLICPRSGMVRSNPALCLLCGEIVCSGSICCQEGKDSASSPGSNNNDDKISGCGIHSKCHGGTGIFLLNSSCMVLYMVNKVAATMVDAPYIDAHGEHDGHLKRGRPLFFDASTYEQIRKSWLNHQIPVIIYRMMEKYPYWRMEDLLRL